MDGMGTWRPSSEIQVDLEWSRRRIAELEKENEEVHEKLETANRQIAELEAENQRLRRQIVSANDSNGAGGRETRTR